MKLSWFECRFLANKLQELVDERKVTPSERRHCDNLIPLFKRLAETPHSPDGRERDMEVPLETQFSPPFPTDALFELMDNLSYAIKKAKGQ